MQAIPHKLTAAITTAITAAMTTVIAPLVALGVLASPALARACAVCTAGRDEENAFAFLVTTVFMSIMPLAALGTLIFVLYRRIQKLEADREATESQASPTDPGTPRLPDPTS